MTELQAFEIECREITKRTRVVTVFATSKTAAIRQIREGDFTHNVTNKRATPVQTSRENVKLAT